MLVGARKHGSAPHVCLVGGHIFSAWTAGVSVRSDGMFMPGVCWQLMHIGYCQNRSLGVCWCVGWDPTWQSAVI